MTLTAVKLVQVQIFVSIRKSIAKKNGFNGKCARPTGRLPATMIAIPLWAFSPRGKNGGLANTRRSHVIAEANRLDCLDRLKSHYFNRP